MAKGIMYDGSTPRGMHLRAVVTQTGDVVAKNYDSRKLIEESREGEPGDVGITVRVDGRTDTLTPAQTASLEHVTGKMSEALLQRIGVETDFGFKPGMVVEATRDREDDGHVGYVEKQTDGGLYLRCFDQGMRLKRVFVPMSVYQVEEVPDRFGLDGMFVHQALKGNCIISLALSKHALSAEACREVWDWLEGGGGDGDPDDALSLLRRIGDRELVHKAANDLESHLRIAAAELVEDQELLVSFLRHEWWKGGDISPIVEKIQDEESIQKAILGWLDNRIAVPEAAWKRITRQDLAIELFQHPGFPPVRGDMLDLVKHTEVLKTLIFTSKAMFRGAIKRLDEVDCKQLVENLKTAQPVPGTENAVRHELLKSIKDQAWLEKYGVEDESGAFDDVVEFLTDHEAALRVMMSHHSYYAYLSRERLLKRLFERVLTKSVRLGIIRDSSDRVWLANLVKGNVACSKECAQGASERLNELGPEAAPEPAKPEKAKRVRKSGPKK
ncbi:MAG: hypothetical protein WC551_02455 [Patescibacteria group bacterium]